MKTNFCMALTILIFWISFFKLNAYFFLNLNLITPNCNITVFHTAIFRGITTQQLKVCQTPCLSQAAIKDLSLKHINYHYTHVIKRSFSIMRVGPPVYIIFLVECSIKFTEPIARRVPIRTTTHKTMI